MFPVFFGQGFIVLQDGPAVRGIKPIVGSICELHVVPEEGEVEELVSCGLGRVAGVHDDLDDVENVPDLRLFRSAAMKARFPEDSARLEHIFTRQLYAMAPTKIIHRIAVAYLLDFNPALREKAKAHIVCADAAAAAQSGTLDKLVEESFG